MSTAMVIATVITTDADVEKVKTFTLEQIRNNDQGLLDRLLDRGVDASVATAILNIDEFLDYMRLRQHKRKKRKATRPAATPAITADAFVDASTNASAVATKAASTAATVVVTDNMSELDFMEHTLQQLHNGKHEPVVQFSEGALETMENEQIGEEFSRQPFLY